MRIAWVGTHTVPRTASDKHCKVFIRNTEEWANEVRRRQILPVLDTEDTGAWMCWELLCPPGELGMACAVGIMPDIRLHSEKWLEDGIPESILHWTPTHQPSPALSIHVVLVEPMSHHKSSNATHILFQPSFGLGPLIPAKRPRGASVCSRGRRRGKLLMTDFPDD